MTGGIFFPPSVNASSISTTMAKAFKTSRFSKKVNSLSFKFFRDYCKSLKLSNAGKLNEEKSAFSFVSRSSIKREITHFHVVVVQ